MPVLMKDLPTIWSSVNVWIVYKIPKKRIDDEGGKNHQNGWRKKNGSGGEWMNEWTAVRSNNRSKRPTIAVILQLDLNEQYGNHKVVLLRNDTQDIWMYNQKKIRNNKNVTFSSVKEMC